MKSLWQGFGDGVSNASPAPSASPRYASAVNAAHRCLMDAGVNRFPVEVTELIARCGAVLQTYSMLAASLRVGADDIARAARTRDAAALRLDGGYAIIYNDGMPPARARFSLMHELGHITLGHLDSGRVGEGVEREADCFARNILAPPLLSAALAERASKNAHALLGISRSAWQVRRSLLPMDMALLLTCHKLEQRALLSTLDYIACAACGAASGGKGRYCAVCGSSLLIWRDKPMMYDEGYALDEYARVSLCPRCDNEDLTADAQFCKICGSPLYNRCTHVPCQARASGNARYCVLCGGVTTFLAAGLLEKVDTNQVL